MSNKRFGSVKANLLNTEQISIEKSNVTQLTAITSGVTCSGNAGVISTVNTTLAAGGSASFTVTNPRASPSSLILANIVGYTGSNGFPAVRVTSVTSGSYSLSLTNIFDAATSGSALNGVVKIGYAIL